MCKDYLIEFLSFCISRVGREMQNVMPLKLHSKISFSVDHATLP